MIWPGFGPDGYLVAIARSVSGKLAGPWTQDEKPLFPENGGHGMIFTAFDGRLMLVPHHPNDGQRLSPS